MSRQKKARAAVFGASGTYEKGTANSIQKDTDNVKSFRKAVKGTMHEAETVIDGIATMKLYYEGGELLRHTVAVTKKYRKAVQP